MRKGRVVRRIKNIMLYLFVFFLSAFSLAEDFADINIEISIEPDIVMVEKEQTEDPAAGYIHQKMYSKRNGLLRISRLAGYSLNGTDFYLYQQLRTKIANVAAGETNTAIFSFPAEDIYEKTEYTATDLGVSALLIKDDEGQWVVNQNAAAALNTIVKDRFNQMDILRCLLADCPYEMYWYDKTVGVITSYPQSSYSSRKVTLTGNVTFSMSVSEEYREAGAAPIEFIINGEKGYRYCHVGTQWGQSVTTAIQAARTIVDQYEDLDDYDRLLAYKNEIRSLASYNDAAAAGEVAFGNPWQLIWVFDGDPETNVVCEGFSKAFQYLNDMSSSNVTVICTSGFINNGPHMWNIVKMDDGQNYLADITNCYTDDGNDYLFLVGYQSHDDMNTYGYETKDSQIIYTYDADNTIYDENDLNVFDKGYLEAKPDTPVFIPGENIDYLLIGEELAFSLQENQGTEYDNYLVKVTYMPEDPNESKKVKREDFEETEWVFDSTFHEAGTYQVQFAGKCGSFTSLYSDPVILNPGVIENLGRLGFTDDTIESLGNILAGDAGYLEWNGIQNGVNSYMIQLVESFDDKEIVFEDIYGAESASIDFVWAFCPGTYRLSFIPDVSVGYAYSADDTYDVIVRYSGKEWIFEEEGILAKYFGSDGNVTVPEDIDGREVLFVGPGAFDKSKAQKVTVPSFIATDSAAFAGKTKLGTIYGYEKSDAEAAAETAGIPFVSLGIKPDAARICMVSSDRGYTGYAVAVRFQEEADAVLIQETKELLPCEGPDVFIPLNNAGENSYTFAAIKDGVRGDYGDSFTVFVNEPGDRILEIPESIQRIEDEAFQSIEFSVVQIPESVQFIGEYAFADNEALQVVKTDNIQNIDDTVFSQSGEFLFCFSDAEIGFSTGKPFLVMKDP